MVTTRSRRAIILLTVLFALAVVTVFVLMPFWQRICGNAPIAFYGQVVDDEGVGLPGVVIVFEGSYSPWPAIPLPNGRTERRWEKTVTTDQNGNFALKRVYGYSVKGKSVRRHGNEVWLGAVGLPLSKDPWYGVMLDDRYSAQKLPDSLAKRVCYRVVPAG